jgi:hypothetical protein
MRSWKIRTTTSRNTRMTTRPKQDIAKAKCMPPLVGIAPPRLARHTSLS